MVVSEYQQLLERKCVALIKAHDPSWMDLGWVHITCVSQNKHGDGPWWEIRCIKKDDRNILLIHKGPSARGRTRFRALELLYEELLNMFDLID